MLYLYQVNLNIDKKSSTEVGKSLFHRFLWRKEISLLLTDVFEDPKRIKKVFAKQKQKGLRFSVCCQFFGLINVKGERLTAMEAEKIALGSKLFSFYTIIYIQNCS